MRVAKNSESNFLENNLRVIGGTWRGRKLKVPVGPGLRPTPNRVRETLFNWLQPVIEGARCLDLFAGSGMLGFEACSRGAEQVLMVENNLKTYQMLQTNITYLATQKITAIYQDSLHYLENSTSQPFHIIFLDPPFDSKLLLPIFQSLEQNHWVTHGSYIYIEESKKNGFSALPDTWVKFRSKQTGEVNYSLVYKEI
ncbi:16S rRNA (guanine(966)-N(2))-methyltransferase RsmD [Candidatus Nitrosacidococcus sp. I8]|uniref:16S rRNA (guanine(966)-N(2))-methyltransferase RsmD n=1 Tax=Candidatus Nitrosacidococcus sp. I8 TaxID=2942908 RepID=UPI002226A0F3|nr:16S rRNA (guanine(966)-N(2))-methyltransferase RsmD [Candidatus Nitrosacidococcus sp. I8]CAH9019164.1 Ribosomal RNA small subunit methyltransferase D [Candidatus Nitrosacidococcus sp. I8]